MKWISWVIVAIALLMTAVLYGRLPDTLPVHWNLAGEADRYAEKPLAALLMPLVMIATALLFEAVPRISPAGFTVEANARGFRAIAVATLVFLLALHTVTLLSGLGVPIDVGLVVPVGMGALFVVIGNYMTTVRKNFFVGIRTPWTLANDDVWFRTHRLGARLFILGGLVLMVASFLAPKPMFAVLIGVTLLVAGVPIVYSYVVYRRLEAEKR